MPHVAVVGAGIIGTSWALVFARAGWDVRVYARHAEVRGSLHARLARSAAAATAIAPTVTVHDIMKRVRIVPTLAEAVDDAEWVQESIGESRDAKTAMFADLDRLTPAHAILASSTSSIGVSLFTDSLAGRDRCIVAHPAAPPHLIPVVEIVPAPWTPPEIVARANATMRTVGQVPVLVRRERPGFVMNRLQGALLTEMFRVIGDGLMSPDDVDALIRDGFGLRWAFLGPLEGVDLNAPGGIADYLRRYGFMFDQMAREGGATEPVVTDEIVATLHAAMRARLPLEGQAARIAWRDGRMSALRRLRMDAAIEDA